MTSRPRLTLEVNVTKLPKTAPVDPSLSPSEQKTQQDNFLHQTSGILMIKFCPVIGNGDFLRKLDKAAVQFKEDPLQWTWTAAMSDHNSDVTEDGLPIGYLQFLIDQLLTVGYTQVGEAEILEPPSVQAQGNVSFMKMIYTFEQPAPKAARAIRM